MIKNLLSNAFKFTQQGKVSLTVGPVPSGWNPTTRASTGPRRCWRFSVSDTGIGIPPDKQQIIFEAFQQADGSTSRKYGGTGLGLAISREIARLLGGEIRLVSSPGQGSTFTLYLPQTLRRRQKPPGGRLPSCRRERRRQAGAPRPTHCRGPILETPKLVNEVGDDRERLQPGDPLLLIVENDLAFARLLLEAAREQGFKGLVTSLGAAALAMTREYKPDAITLDICLPDIDGWRVIDRLKNDMTTRHIPVCVISTEEAHDRASSYGALGVARPSRSRTARHSTSLLDTIRDFIEPAASKDLVLVGSRRRGAASGSLESDRRRIEFRVTDGRQRPGGRSTSSHKRNVDCVVLDPRPARHAD